jgi:hypothetical protein
MKSRPTIFLSGVSHEFGTNRDAVENEIEMKGCFAENQPGFPPDYRTVEDMLTRKLGECDAARNRRSGGIDRRQAANARPVASRIESTCRV